MSEPDDEVERKFEATWDAFTGEIDGEDKSAYRAFYMYGRLAGIMEAQRNTIDQDAKLYVKNHRN